MSNEPVVEVEKIHLIDVNANTPTKAIVDICILEDFVIKGLRIVLGGTGLFVTMPNSQGRDGLWYDVFQTKDPDMARGIEEIVLKAYQEELKK